MKALSILGSTGSIGRNTLEIVEMFPGRFTVTALAAKTNTVMLAQQIERFDPEIAVVFDAERADELKGLLPASPRVEVLFGDEGYQAAAAAAGAEMVVTAMVGAAGLKPTLAAIEAGKDIALANKETLVMAGELVIKRAAQQKVRILPVDSEHSAIFQCLRGHRRQDVEKILLTASGGPFLNRTWRDLEKIKPEQAVDHPTWRMGPKISVDSATLMNKGLEVIEAQHLFDIAADRIEILIHPQSIVHSMVAYKDGAVMAQLGNPDMKGAIAYALSHPERLPLTQGIPDFAGLGRLNFQRLAPGAFPCLELAFSASRTGGTLPAVLNAANEAAVYAFLDRRIKFTDIPAVIERTMARHRVDAGPSLAQIVAADQWARAQAREMIAAIEA